MYKIWTSVQKNAKKREFFEKMCYLKNINFRTIQIGIARKTGEAVSLSQV